MLNPPRSWFALPTATVVIARKGKTVATLRVELARNPLRRALGLMGRVRLPEDGGMLLTYPWPRIVRIWMARVPMSLDVLFIDAQDTVTSIVTELAPLSLRVVSSDERVMRVLEIAAGASARAHIAVGDTVCLRPDAVVAGNRLADFVRTRVARLIGRQK